MTNQEWIKKFHAQQSRDCFDTDSFDVELTVWKPAVEALKPLFARFEFLTAVDQVSAGISLVLCLQDREGCHVLLRTQCVAGTPVESLTPIFSGAAWHEREVSEMFGVEFEGGSPAKLLLNQDSPINPMLKSFLLASREDQR